MLAGCMRRPGLPPFPLRPLPSSDRYPPRPADVLRLGCTQLNNAAQSGDPNFVVQVRTALGDSLSLPRHEQAVRYPCSNQRLRMATAVTAAKRQPHDRGSFLTPKPDDVSSPSQTSATHG